MSDPYRTGELPASAPDPFPSTKPSVAPFSGPNPTCRKCRHTHLAGSMDRYIADSDTIVRKCIGCGFSWVERAADSEGA